MSMAFCSAGVRLRPLVFLSYHVQCIYTSHDQAHADKSIPRFSPAAARLIPAPKKPTPRDLGRPTATGSVRPSGTAVYLCCLLRATASLRLSTECNCFSTGTTAARQVCSKHPLIKSLFAESLIDVLVHRCTATTALLQLLSDTAMPRLSHPCLRI